MRKNQSYTISIIVPIYNSEDNLEKCVKSIIEQTYKNIEILLIDDGSTDSSGNICDNMKKKDERIKVFHKKNGGVSSARNLGILRSTGEYLIFVDADDSIESNAIEALLSLTDDKVLPKLSTARYFKKIIKYEENQNVDSSNFINLFMLSKRDGYCWGYLFKKNKIKMDFDENTSYLEDALFIINYLDNITEICYTGSVYYNYNNTNLGISSSNGNILKKIDDAIYSIDMIKNCIKKYNITNLDIKIINKKILIIEYLLQNITKSNLKKIFASESINEIFRKYDKSNGLGKRYDIFVILFIKKRKYLILIYYFFKKIYKKIRG